MLKVEKNQKIVVKNRSPKGHFEGQDTVPLRKPNLGLSSLERVSSDHCIGKESSRIIIVISQMTQSDWPIYSFSMFEGKGHSYSPQTQNTRGKGQDPKLKKLKNQ